MTLWEFVEVFDPIQPLWVQRDGCIPDYYKNSGELIEKNEFGCYGRVWDLDEDIVEYVTLDGDGIVTVEVKEA